jgi:hypothetical protein
LLREYGAVLTESSDQERDHEPGARHAHLY